MGFPIFIRTNYILTATWGTAFALGVAIAWFRMQNPEVPAWICESIHYSLMFAAILFSTWYPKYVS